MNLKKRDKQKPDIMIRSYFSQSNTKDPKGEKNRICKVIKFIFYSTVKLLINLANAGRYASMRPLEVIVGIIVGLILVLPICVFLAVWWEMLLEALF